VLTIFPEIINRMVVKMMDQSSDLRASENRFRCILNLWRTFYHIYVTMPGMRNTLTQKVKEFIANPAKRNKAVTPNIGHTLVMSTMLKQEEVSWRDFLGAYEDEGGLRRVLWWQKDGVPMTGEATYANSVISRKNTLFQVMFKRMVITIDDIDGTIHAIDTSFSKLPDRLNPLLEEWKKVTEACAQDRTWSTHLRVLQQNGLPKGVADGILADIGAYLRGCVARANKLEGYHFQTRGSATSSDRAPAGRQPPCNTFMRLGRCNFGDQCRYSHDR
jgi:hypothetical protein